jgi:hypothetical protein
MAASGFTTFDNDDAMDWLDGFGSDGASAVQVALEAVTELDPLDYLEAPDASHALAAAEVVAAARDGDTSRLPKDAVQRLKDNAAKINAVKLIAPARRAVMRVLKNSELKELWEDSPDSEDWEMDVRELLERLKG